MVRDEYRMGEFIIQFMSLWQDLLDAKLCEKRKGIAYDT